MIKCRDCEHVIKNSRSVSMSVRHVTWFKCAVDGSNIWKYINTPAMHNPLCPLLKEPENES
jgi:hypothetical protein